MLQDAGLIKGADLSVSITGDTFFEKSQADPNHSERAGIPAGEFDHAKDVPGGKSITDLIP